MRSIHASLWLSALASVAAVSGEVAGDLDPADMDTGVEPGEDFYRYANGGWLDRTQIPAERSAWGLGAEVNERNRHLLRELLDEAAAAQHEGAKSLARKLGDFWSSALAQEEIDAQGIAPLRPILARIDAIAKPADLAVALARLHAIGVEACFAFGAEAGLRDTGTVMGWGTQGGLGLPDRDYYTREDEEAQEIRAKYVEHVARMFILLGDEEAKARENAEKVLKMETRLASKSLTNVQLRNPKNYEREVTVTQVRQSMPNFDWTTYLSEVGLASIEVMNLPMPEFFAELDLMLIGFSLADWKTYLRWHLVHGLATALASDVEGEHFRFNGTVLAGIPEMEPRWKRVLAATDAALGEALGQLYVARAFSPAAKERATAMVNQLLEVMGDRIRRVEWMGEETKDAALTKLASFRCKIGYPDEWRDYGGLTIVRDSYAANVMQARRHEFAYEMSKVGEPVDPGEWEMTPQTLNAYYHPLRNEIVFPAAILQPPFFGEHLDDPLNYGGVGAVIGHEITHGFDDSGSQFAADGSLSNWWTDADREEFEARARKLVEQYAAYEPLPGVFVNGELTLGENIADLGGLSIAFEAMQRANEGKEDSMLGGFTREQRFFLAYARVWRGKRRDPAMRLMVNTNPHAPARYRALGSLANMPEFAEAFELPEDAPMMRSASERAEIW